MKTENDNIEIVIDPKSCNTDAIINFQCNAEPKCTVVMGCIDAIDQMEDLLDKFTCLDAEFKTQIMSIIGNFIQSHGFKIVETGAVVPQ